MAVIHQLAPEVYNKIAAGEVIERPASVVKELVENALDAGAARIDVQLEQGGVDLIRVVDDGAGLAAEDLPLAFASHATSKLATADDLFRIGTLGFRGEALASIGSVAHVLLASRRRGDDHGAAITCEGSDLGPVKPWNGASGTQVEVRRLFYNVPVRRQFLRTHATELGHVTETITRLALSRQGLHVRLAHNDREVYDVPASTDVGERIGLFFGEQLGKQLIPIQNQHGPATLTGFIADPASDRGNARMQYFFVNGRWIRDRSLGHALQEAYRGLLMTGRYSVGFLFITLPPDLVDVNVHPTKAEVRFRDSQAIYHLVFSTVRGALHRADLTASFNPASRLRPVAPALASPTPNLQGHPTLATPVASLPATPSTPDLAAPPAGVNGTHAPAPLADGQQRAIQLYDAYLVVETPEGMLVIDQHALHERIIYEHWKERIRAGDVEVQRLLVPEPVDLPGEQAALALEQAPMLKRIGLEVDDFGGGTLLIRSYPAMLPRSQPDQLLRVAIDYFASKDRAPTAELLLDDLLKMMACKAAIKAGDHLGPDEIAALLAQRHLADDTHHCPHGRPTALLFSKQDLDRQFKRI